MPRTASDGAAKPATPRKPRAKKKPAPDTGVRLTGDRLVVRSSENG